MALSPADLEVLYTFGGAALGTGLAVTAVTIFEYISNTKCGRCWRYCVNGRTTYKDGVLLIEGWFKKKLVRHKELTVCTKCSPQVMKWYNMDNLELLLELAPEGPKWKVALIAKLERKTRNGNV